MSGCSKLKEKIVRLEQENAGLRSLLDFEIQKREVQSDYPILASNYTVQKYYTDKEYEKLKEENERLKEKIIKLTEENGNLIINRNTVENKLRDTESRLVSVQKANTHNLVLLQRRNYILEEIREIAKNQDLYRGRQALATKILQIIENVYQKESEAKNV